MKIEITSKADRRTYECEFVAVRKLRNYIIGWAVLVADGLTFKFPTIITPYVGHVLTASDWQTDFDVSFPDLDLADPDQVRNLIITGCGKFFNPRTGRDTNIDYQFAVKR